MGQFQCGDLQITFSSAEAALNVSRQLVKERLVACAHVQAPGISIYQWQGSECEEAESLVHYKTSLDRLDALKRRVIELHSYDCPAISLSVINDGHEEYLKWIYQQTRP